MWGAIRFLAAFCAGALLVLTSVQCTRKPPYQVDISGVKVEPVTINRYEEVLFSINPFLLREEIDPYIETYYIFLGDEINDSTARRRLYDYITDPFIKELYVDSKEVWDKLRDLEAGLTTAFAYYKAHYPEENTPRVYSYISGLDYHLPVKYADDHLIIGLDLYLGRNYAKYGEIGIPAYKAQRMEPAFVIPDAVLILADKHMQSQAYIPETFLDYMIYEGKRLYFADCMLPSMHDTLKIGYTADQLRWMQRNQTYVWSYYIDNSFLYSSDRLLINKFVGDAPFTSAFSRNSAPRTAVWLGWQIVREYMRRHPEVSLQALLAEQDAQKILQQSRYRPK